MSTSGAFNLFMYFMKIFVHVRICTIINIPFHFLHMCTGPTQNNRDQSSDRLQLQPATPNPSNRTARKILQRSLALQRLSQRADGLGLTLSSNEIAQQIYPQPEKAGNSTEQLSPPFPSRPSAEQPRTRLRLESSVFESEIKTEFSAFKC